MLLMSETLILTLHWYVRKYLLNYKPKYFYDASNWYHLDLAAFLSPVRHFIARHAFLCPHPTTSENANKNFILFSGLLIPLYHKHLFYPHRSFKCNHPGHISRHIILFLLLHSNMMRKSTIIDSLIDGCDFSDMLALFLDHPAALDLGPFCGLNPVVLLLIS